MKAFLSLLAFAFIASFSGNVQAQQQWESGMYLDLLVPNQGMMKNLDDHGGVALRWQVGKQIKHTPLIVGGELATGIFGCYMDEYYVNEQEKMQAILENHTFGGNIFVRLEPFKTCCVRPYLEGKLGGKLFYTSLLIEDPTIDDKHCPEENDISEEIIQSSWAWNYSLGGGLMFKIFEYVDQSHGVYADLNLTKIYGSTAGYMSSDFTTVYNTRTDMWQLGLGLVVKF